MALVLFAGLLLTIGVFPNEAAQLQASLQTKMTSATSLKAMESVFYRSEKTHSLSMSAITRSMSAEMALQVLRKHNDTTPALLQVAEKAMSSKGSKLLRAQVKDINGIKELLNGMIFESMTKYDDAIARCTSFYSDQCAQMEVARGKISAKNSLGANARSLILDAQAMISRCSEDIPETKEALLMHNRKCDAVKTKMKGRIKILESDLTQMQKILDDTLPSVCPASTLLLQSNQSKDEKVEICYDECTGKPFIRVGGHKTHHLRSSIGVNLMRESFEDDHSLSFLQTRATSFDESGDLSEAPGGTKVTFNNPPAPRTAVPANPCMDPNVFDGNPGGNKRAAKCVLPKGSCDKMKERFLKIQSGLQDDADQVKDRFEIANRSGMSNAKACLKRLKRMQKKQESQVKKQEAQMVEESGEEESAEEPEESSSEEPEGPKYKDRAVNDWTTNDLCDYLLAEKMNKKVVEKIRKEGINGDNAFCLSIDVADRCLGKAITKYDMLIVRAMRTYGFDASRMSNSSDA